MVPGAPGEPQQPNKQELVCAQNMPRPNLRQAQPLIRAFCQQHGLPYSEASLFGSYAEAVRHLHTVGASLRPAAAE
jgi:hypothetical protein